MAVCIGCGLEVVDGLLQVDLAAGGGIVCVPGDGLALASAGYTPTESPDACNGFEVRGNGLYAPCPDAVNARIGQDSINNDYLDGAGLDISAPNSYGFTSGPPAVIGNHTCRGVGGIIAIRAGGLYLDADNGFYGTCRLRINADGIGWTEASPDGKMVFENKSGSNLHTAFNNFVDENWITIPAFPGSITYEASLVVEVLAGTGTLTGFIQFEYIVSLPQIGNC